MEGSEERMKCHEYFLEVEFDVSEILLDVWLKCYLKDFSRIFPYNYYKLLERLL